MLVHRGGAAEWNGECRRRRRAENRRQGKGGQGEWLMDGRLM